MEKNKIIRMIGNFKNKKIMVIGDIMLDKQISGDVLRISPEAPVPILKVKDEEYAPGGAANLANNIASLGAEVFLLGVVGKDNTQQILFKKLEERNINTSYIIKTLKRQTTQKVRSFSNQQLFRIDYETEERITAVQENLLLSMIKRKLPKVDAVILCDYNKGVLTKRVVEEVISRCKKLGKLVTADCKPSNLPFYKGVDLIKPNKKEAIEMTSEHNIKKSGKLLVKELGAQVVITLGSEGCLVFGKEGKIFYLGIIPQEIYDVTGAGDTFLGVLTLAMTCGLPLKESAEISNKASAIVVGKPGVSVINAYELINSFKEGIKIVPKRWGEEQWLVNNNKYCGKKLIIKKDHYCSYHMHKIKTETFYVVKGKLEMIYKGKYFKIKEGEVFNIRPREYHSFRALEDTIFFEFSTKHLDSDTYRMTKGGVGSTNKWKKEIKGLLRVKHLLKKI